MTGYIILGRRVLAVAILVLLIALVWLWVVQPIAASYSRYDETIADSGRLMAHYKRVVGERTVLESRVDGLQNDDSAARPLLLSGASTDLIAADLQSRIGDLIARYDGERRSVQVIPDKSDTGFAQIGLKVNMRGTTASMLEIFHAIESSKPLLFLDNIIIRGPRVSRRTIRDGQGTVRTVSRGRARDVLQVTFEVYGFAEVPAS